MASPHSAAVKFYRLENPASGRFWEITVGEDQKSRIRSGKMGCQGRLFAPKSHESALRALQFARWHVDSKCYEGFVKVREESKEVPKMRGTPNPEKPPLKKRPAMRRTLSRQQSVKKQAASAAPRLPPKKQQTIRRLVPSPEKPPLKKRVTIRRPQISKKQATAEEAKTPRLPLKKQQTIRRLARTKTMPFEITSSAKPVWRKPPRKQSTIRRNYKKQEATSSNSDQKILHVFAQRNPRTSQATEMVKRGGKRKAMDAKGDEEIPFKTYRSDARLRTSGEPTKMSASKMAAGNPRGKKRTDPRVTHGKAYQLNVSPPASPNSEIEPVITPAERRGKIAVGIITKPPLTRIRSKGKTLNQVSLPTVADSVPPNLSRKPSKRNAKFVQPKVPGLKKEASLRRQVLKRGLARQDTLEMEPEMEPEPSSVSFRNKTLSRMPSLTVGPDHVYIPARKEWPLEMLAPVIWRHVATEPGKQNTHAHAVYADEHRVLFGDERGYVIEVDGDGNVVSVFFLFYGETKKTPAVKCIIRQHNHLYVGCSDGCVYDISQGVPLLVYSPSQGQQHVEIESMAMLHGLLLTVDIRGRVTAVNHDGLVVWQVQGPGPGGRMLCVDESAVYHGHYMGVTKYCVRTGRTLWSVGKDWKAAVLAGCWFGSHVYAAANAKVGKLRTQDGQIVDIYKAEGIVTSLSVAAGLVYAADHHFKITIFDEVSSAVVYKLTHNITVLSMQYHSGRLYTVGPGGLSVVELSKKSVTAAKKGEPLPVPWELPSIERMPTLKKTQGPLEEVPRTVEKIPRAGKVPCPGEKAAPRGKVILRCLKDPKTKKLRVTPQSPGFKRQLSCQFPVNLRKEGATFLVSGLEESTEGQFYRVSGDIVEVEGYGT